MAFESIDGRWQATGSRAVNSEIKPASPEQPDAEGVFDWLNGFDPGLMSETTPTSGLLLTIAVAQGTFAEIVTGRPRIEWFDAEGVLAEEVSPFGGTVVHSANVAYLLPADVPDWALPKDGRYGSAILRYDDGDTKIADSVRIVGEHLIRTVNVVTDELYLNRVIIVYEKAL